MLSKITILIAILVGALAITLSLGQDQAISYINLNSANLETLETAQDKDEFYVDAAITQIISMEIIPLAPSLRPTIQIFDPNEEEIPLVSNESLSDPAIKTAVLYDIGRYHIIVSDENGGIGPYVLKTRQLGQFTLSDHELQWNQPVTARISEDTYLQRFWISASPDGPLAVVIDHSVENAVMGVSLKNLDWLQSVGEMNMNVGVGAFCIPSGDDIYTLDLMNVAGIEGLEYTILVTDRSLLLCEDGNLIDILLGAPIERVDLTDLTTLISSDTDGNGDPESTPESDSNPEVDSQTGCNVTSDQSVNIRALPSTAAPIVATLDGVEGLPIVGWVLNRTWAQVRLADGRLAFIHTGVVNVAEACATANLPDLHVDENQLLELEASVEGVGDVNVGVDVNEEGIVVTLEAPIIDDTIEDVIDTVDDVVPTVPLPVSTLPLPNPTCIPLVNC